MTATLRIFVSSVQKELEDERLIVQNLVNTDPFLSAHCVPVLYEFEPASPAKALDECLKALDACNVYLLIVGVQYGALVGEISMTHAEYRQAKGSSLPVLAFIKGERQVKRENGTAALLAELDADGPKYKRFGNVIELQKEVRAALVKLLLGRFGIAPTNDENEIAEQTIEATSLFESRMLSRVHWQDIDRNVACTLIAAAEKRNPDELANEELLAGAALRGLVWHDPSSRGHYATAAGIVLLARDPSAVFPQCRILADAYRSNEPDGDPRDHEDIRGPMPLAIERSIAFIDRNTRHPMRIVGLNRVRLDEYPVDSLREALVNAVAHRQYEDAGRKIILEVFAEIRNLLSKMDDLDISPLVGQVFGDEAAVAVIRRLFAAKEAAVGHECSREVLFDFAFRDEFQKSPPVGIPVTAVLAVCLKERAGWRRDRAGASNRYRR